jgi:hypothetical protein
MAAWFQTNLYVQMISNVIAGPVALVLALYGMKAGSILRLATSPPDHLADFLLASTQ